MRILGTGSCMAALEKSNDDFAEIMETSDEWIRTRTGIRTRPVCSTETLLDMAHEASVKALEMSGVDLAEIDTIICTTLCGDYITPSMSCLISKRLDISCRCFDMNAACSGFIYALEVAHAYMQSGIAKKVLVVSAETMTRFVDWTDRSTCVLFGDGAGAVVLGPGEDLLSIAVTGKGDEEIMNIPNPCGSSPFDQVEKKDAFLYMNGKEVYKFAIASVCKDLETVVNAAGISQEEIDYVLLHQANLRIIGGAQKRLSIPAEKFLSNIEHTGNTSSASIPILLDEENRKGTFKKGDILAMSAFGGGLTTAACIMKWGI